MRKPFVFDSLVYNDRLESRLSLSSMLKTTAVIVPGDDEVPPPGPEPDPGDFPGSNPPIVYPDLPPSGPVGPG